MRHVWLLVLVAALPGCAGTSKGGLPGGAALRLDARSLHVERRVTVTGNPCGIAAGPGTLYVTDLGTSTSGEPGDGALITIGSRSARRTARLGLGQTAPCLVTAGGAGVFVVRDRQMSWVDGRVRWTVPAGREPSALTMTKRAVWTADLGGDQVIAFDAATGARTALVSPVGGPADIAAGRGAVWVATTSRPAIVRIDPATGRSRRTPLRAPAKLVAAGAEGVFIIRGDRTLSRLDPATGRIVKSADAGLAPKDLAVGDGAVWVLSDAGELHRVAPRSLRAVRTLRFAGDAAGIAIGTDAVWLLTRSRGS